MNLYTVTVHFEDHLIGIGQHDAGSPYEALVAFVQASESLEGFDRVALSNALGGESRLTHIADGLRGFWSWHPMPSEEDDEPLLDVLGGHIIQTDPNGPLRASTA